MADQHDAACIVLLGIGHGGVEAGVDAFGIGLVGLLAGLFGIGALRSIGIGGGGLGDVGVGVGRGVLGRCGFALVFLGFAGRLVVDACLRAVGKQVGQGDAQAVPADIREFLPQGGHRVGPVGVFTGTGDDDHRTLRVAVIGGLPQGQKTVGAGLQGLLLYLGHPPFKGLGVFLAALQQRRPGRNGGWCICGSRCCCGIGSLGAQREDRGQAAHCQRRAIKCGHESTQGQNDTGSLIVFARDGHAAWPPLPRRACR
ncbi:hypothetical protein D3C76_627340 [compost metagenome]